MDTKLTAVPHDGNSPGLFFLSLLLAQVNRPYRQRHLGPRGGENAGPFLGIHGPLPRPQAPGLVLRQVHGWRRNRARRNVRKLAAKTAQSCGGLRETAQSLGEEIGAPGLARNCPPEEYGGVRGPSTPASPLPGNAVSRDTQREGGWGGGYAPQRRSSPLSSGRG